MVRVRYRVGNRVSDLRCFWVNFELFVDLLGFIWGWKGFGGMWDCECCLLVLG